MDKLQRMAIFLAVIDENGFIGAARKLGISAPGVTRAVGELERQLGVSLLARTTRTLRVTEAGRRYASYCRRILRDMAEADDMVAGLQGSARGQLSVTAPVLFGNRFVTPILADYLHAHREVQATTMFVDRLVNIIDEGIEVAIRIGHLPNSSMQAIKVGTVRRVICAAPHYLGAHGTPHTPADLSQHATVLASAVTPTADWTLYEEGHSSAVKLAPRLTTSSNDSALSATVAGLGLCCLLSYQVDEALRNGQLQRVLEDFEAPPLPVHLLHREGRHVPGRVRSFLDLAIERLRAEPSLNWPHPRH